LKTTRLSRAAICIATAVIAGTWSTPASGACVPWQASTVLSGQGPLENLVFDGRGGLLLSAIVDNAILRLGKNGDVTTLIDDVYAPGGLRVRRGVLYFNTGDNAVSGVQGIADGTIDRYRFESGRRSTWARGLTMPNGLVFLPNGDAVVSRDLGTGTGMTRIRARNPEHPQFNWARLDDTNGMAVDPTGRWLYTVETFSAESRVYRIRVNNPSRIRVVASLGGGAVPKGLDDLTIDRRGRLYITANIAGEVIRLNPSTGANCVLASGLRNPSAVKFGRGPGWSKRSLYVTGFDGAVTRLTPPAR
jgi:SMP-30/Gluconolactonase/LRE-like region